MSVTDRFVNWWSSLAAPSPRQVPLPPPEFVSASPKSDDPVEFVWTPDNDGTDWGHWRAKVDGKWGSGISRGRKEAERRAKRFADQVRSGEMDGKTEYL